MGRITDNVQRARDTKRPTGRYTIDLINARSGRIADRIEKDNYVTELWELYQIAHQYGNPYLVAGVADDSTYYDGESLYLTNGGPFANRVFNPGSAPTLPFDSLLCTDWDSPEDPAVHWGRGRISAWATRWKSTVDASGLRGQVNEAESIFSNDGLTHKTVWDWTTSQGNGSFQSVMLGGAFEFGNPAVQGMWTGVGPETIAYGDHASTFLQVQSNLWIEGATTYFIASNSNATNATLNIFSMATADIFAATPRFNEPWVRNGVPNTVTSVCSTGLSLSVAATTTTTNASPFQRCTMGLVKLSAGGDFCIVWIGTNGDSATSANGRRMWFRRITPAGVQVVANVQFGDTASQNMYRAGASSTTLTSFPAASISATFDGTFLYAHAGCNANFGAGVKEKIYRVNVADGTLSTTIAYPAGYESCTDGGITLYDGDILVSTLKDIIRIDTGGTLVAPYSYGSIALGHYGFSSDQIKTETAIAPWNTNVGFYRGLRGQGTILEGRYDFTGRSSPTTIVFNAQQTAYRTMGASPTTVAGLSVGILGDTRENAALARGTMVVYDGELWVQIIGDPSSTAKPLQRTDIWSASVNPAFLMKVTGANIFSRARLDSPATKSSAQNMKISYEITFPDPYIAGRVPSPDQLAESTGPTS
jgi:hypothetical protein